MGESSQEYLRFSFSSKMPKQIKIFLNFTQDITDAGKNNLLERPQYFCNRDASVFQFGHTC